MLQKFNFSRFMVNSVCFKDSSLRNFLETCLWLVGRSCSNLSGYERCLVGLILCAVRRKKNFIPVLHQRSIFGLSCKVSKHLDASKMLWLEWSRIWWRSQKGHGFKSHFVYLALGRVPKCWFLGLWSNNIKGVINAQFDFRANLILSHEKSKAFHVLAQKIVLPK